MSQDVNECSAMTHDCHSNADCTNTNGGFTCACKSGFTGDGNTCAEGIKTFFHLAFQGKETKTEACLKKKN